MTQFIGVPVSGASASQLRTTPIAIYRVGSSDVVFVLATTGCALPSCLRLFRSTSAAESFTRENPPPVRAEQGTFAGTLRSMQFANVSDGYAIVGTNDPTSLYATNNGARTWHKVTIQKGVTTLGLTTTLHEIYAITGICSTKGSCHDYRIARSPLSANRWTSSPMPMGHSAKYGMWGFPYVPDAFGNDVWISEQPPGPALIPETAVALWADCPTGMQESFFFSKNAGVTWTSAPQQQFMGTGGGSFDPVSASLAFLDYGGPGPFVRITTSPRKATTIGAPSCSKDSSIGDLTFTNGRDGLSICSPNSSQAGVRLVKSIDGGKKWLSVSLTSA